MFISRNFILFFIQKNIRMKGERWEGVLFIEVWILSTLLSAFREIKFYLLAPQISVALEVKQHFLIVLLQMS